jgi:preprotein translocase subunit SecE
MNKLIEYINAAIAEMKKVTWPTKKEAKNYTLIVIGFSIGVALFLGLLDYIFSFGISKIISRF